MPLSQKFKKRIAELISDSNTKMTDLANKIPISHSTLSQANNYGIVPTPQIVIKIADFFAVPMDYVLGATDDENYIPTDLNEGFLTRLDFLLKSNNLTFYSLAVNHLFIAKNSLSTWKKKSGLPSIENLIIISNHFKCSIDYLVGRTDIPEKYKIADDFEIDYE